MKRVVVVFCLVVGWCRAGAAAEETVSPDWTTATNYLANACSEIHGTSNANVRVLTMDESVASIESELSEAELVDKSLKGLLHILEKDGFASVKEADYVGLSFYKEGFPEGWERPHFRPHAFAFRSAYVTTGNGWRRKVANGKAEYLAFDAVWWPGSKDRLEGFSLDEERPRLARDEAKVRACLRDAAENPEDAGFRYQAEEMDVFALAFALHLQQRGQDKDAQSIYDALNLRPAAAEAAFAKLRRRVKLGKRQNRGK